MFGKKASKKEEDYQKEIVSHKIETSLLSDAYFQLKETTKKLEEEGKELFDSEEKFAAAFHAAPYLMAITKIEDGTIIEVNEGYTQLLGYSREESIGKTTSELSIWANSKDRAVFAETLGKFGQITDFETTLRRKDGKIATVLDSARTIILKNEKCILSIAHDITERKHLEMENVRINRALRMLSEINQTLIHIVDEASLLDKACHIITRSGGYRSVWIGFAEDSKEKNIRPVSYIGYEPGYLESFNLTWADNERGSGPEGIAIRSGKPCVKRNVITDPEMTLWREDALKHGYQSVIALPLINNNKELGVLNIYSDKLDAFTSEEIEVLEELTNDLAFGIVSERIKVEHKLLEEELLKASTDRYKALFIASRDAIMTLEPPTWNFTSGNPATVAMFKAKNEGDFLYRRLWELSPEFQPDGRNSAEKAKDMIDKAMSEGVNFFEWKHKRLDGEEFLAEVSLSRVEMNEKIFLHAVVRDITERKKVEAKVKEYAEEKFKAIFDNTSDGMIMVDIENHKFILGNNSIYQMLGYTPEEFKLVTIENIHPKENLSQVLKQFEKQVKGELRIAESVPVKRKDGSIFYADINASTVTVEGKKYVLGVFRDITERRRAEEVLKESEEKYRLLVENAPIGVFSINQKGEIVDINPIGPQILGSPSIEATKSINVLTFSLLVEVGFSARVKDCFEKGEKSIFEFPYTSKWGKIVYLRCHLTPIFDVNKKINIVQLLLEDFTERKKAEILLDEANSDLQKFRLAVENASDHVIITNLDGVVLYANPAASKITGYTATEMVGHTPRLWGGQMSTEFYEQLWKRIREDKKTFTGEINNKRKSGESYQAAVSVSPILDEKGNILFFVGIERDVTKERAIDKAKTEFVTLASHQLRTPLSGTKWLIETMQRGVIGEPNPKQKEYLENLYQINERMITLVSDILNILTLESGVTAVKKEKIPVLKLYEDLLLTMEPAANSKKIKLKATLRDDDKTFVKSNFLVLRTILENFISNSICYSEEGEEVIVGVNEDPKEIVFSVKDNGIGISKDDKNKIFERFYRGYNARMAKPEGTGLGLYTSSLLAQKIDAKITFESEEGRGSTFYLHIPKDRVI